MGFENTLSEYDQDNAAFDSQNSNSQTQSVSGDQQNNSSKHDQEHVDFDSQYSVLPGRRGLKGGSAYPIIQ